MTSRVCRRDIESRTIEPDRGVPNRSGCATEARILRRTVGYILAPRQIKRADEDNIITERCQPLLMPCFLTYFHPSTYARAHTCPRGRPHVAPRCVSRALLYAAARRGLLARARVRLHKQRVRDEEGAKGRRGNSYFSSFSAVSTIIESTPE